MSGSILTWVERNFSFATAHAYAGHYDEADTKNATLTYVKATVHNVATALSTQRRTTPTRRLTP
jgi:integrase/recombinase XerC